MDTINIRQLRASLATAVRRAGAGERVAISVQGRPIAQLGPLEPLGGEASLDDLAQRGLVTRPHRDDRPEPDTTIDAWVGTRLDRTVTELRGR
jgi:antitoxin (DNA-binding transcriptional repressor) of toxin-antitoxin stability system